eukprot:CAMPEP_0173212336 /NCGR_PEP_ID=MMETSP1141-20130122/24739_1 /TAXON_ID=483371 /ORGANISM="non described non described, Strain CCMP2298" /LENGTH=81 /DNA_ID=CAMNT_0014139335 /DNA_START=41 /DNA_END=283 /DNA_ORIENTATION=-
MRVRGVCADSRRRACSSIDERACLACTLAPLLTAARPLKVAKVLNPAVRSAWAAALTREGELASSIQCCLSAAKVHTSSAW